VLIRKPFFASNYLIDLIAKIIEQRKEKQAQKEKKDKEDVHIPKCNECPHAGGCAGDCEKEGVHRR
jgi:radical SAM protein with 4Fe4S-binding SPASM domain